MLDEIRSGQYARGWIDENADGPAVVRSAAARGARARHRAGRRRPAGADAVPQAGQDRGRGSRRRRHPRRMAKARVAVSPATHARESRRLSTLLEVSQALSGTLNLRSALHRVLEILAKHHGTVRGHGDPAARQRRAARRGLRRPRRAVACRPLPARRRHHRQGGRERQADRRAARQQGAGVSQPRVEAAASSPRKS